jgi:hypothetical protein
VRARCADYFAAQAAGRMENLARRERLVTVVESLADSSDWGRALQEISQAQTEWRTLGPGPWRETRALTQRFHAATERFFTRRKADLARRKEVWAANFARKQGLCERAEALAASTEWDAAAAEIRRLQTEWKTIGPVRRSQSEAIWQRFRSACDAFFERYRHRDEAASAARVAERDTVCAQMEHLADAAAAGEGGDAPADLLGAARALRGRWQHAPAVPREAEERLAERFDAALVRLVEAAPDRFRGTELDLDANHRRLEQLCARVENLAPRVPSSGTETSPAFTLAQQLREALAANTIGGRVDEEAKWRAAAEDVRRAQEDWHRVGPVRPGVQAELLARFQRAAQRVFDQRRRSQPATPARR